MEVFYVNGGKFVEMGCKSNFCFLLFLMEEIKKWFLIR